MKKKFLKLLVLITGLIVGPSFLYHSVFRVPTCDQDFMDKHIKLIEKNDINHCDGKYFRDRGYTYAPKGEFGCKIPTSEKLFSPSSCIVDVVKAHPNLRHCDQVTFRSVCDDNKCYETYYDYCYQQIPNLLSNPEWCDEIKEKEKCKAYIARETNNLELCKQVAGQHYSGQNCITHIASYRKDPSLCRFHFEDSFDESYVKYCIRDVILKISDNPKIGWNHCLEIKDLNLRNDCLDVLLPLSETPSLCRQHLNGCIRIRECEGKASVYEDFNPYQFGKEVREACEVETTSILSRITTPVLGEIEEGESLQIQYDENAYLIDLVFIQPYYSIDELDSYTLRVNDEIIRNFPPNQAYILENGLAFIVTDLWNEHGQRKAKFILGRIL